MGKDGLSGDDVAQLLSVSPRTLRNWRRERRGPPCEIVNLQPLYPVTGLIPWLKKHRPDLALEPEALLRYRSAKKAEREDAKDEPWADFLPDSPENQRDRREQEGYRIACKLDAEGKYDEADKVLRKAGVARDVVEHRRRHVEYRLSQRMGAIE